MHVASVRGSVLLCLRSDRVCTCTSGFVDDVIFLSVGHVDAVAVTTL